MNKPYVVAHRGFSAKYKPNSWLAIQKAFEYGADICEIDVQITKDNKAVLFHDYYIEGKRVAELYYDDLKRIGLVDLREIISYSSEFDKKFIIEIKDRRFLSRAKEYLKQARTDLIIVSSFDAVFLREFKSILPEFRTCILLGSVLDSSTALILSDYANAEYILPAWENRSPYPHKLINRAWIEDVRECGKQVIIWHEERREELENLIKLPVFGICTNDVELLRSLIDEE